MYFAVKTRQQEIQELYERLDEDGKRLFLRGDIKQKNMLLYEAAKQAGIQTTYEYAAFTDKGYMGLYGGLGVTRL
jgi:DNA-damage-inducible protein D